MKLQKKKKSRRELKIKEIAIIRMMIKLKKIQSNN
jgi:hypothetical protein